MTDRPTNQPTNRQTDMRGHREVSIAIINNITKISLILAMIVKLSNELSVSQFKDQS